jgi:hypothetical protein
MPGIRGAGLLLFLAALLVGLFADDPVGEFSALEAAGLLGLGGLSFLMAGSIVEGFSRHWTYGVQSIAISGGILIALIVTYASRGELQTVIDRAIGDISVGRTVVTADGEVVAARRTDGSFMVQGEVNGHETRFIFDTGASTVVLRAENAAGQPRLFHSRRDRQRGRPRGSGGHRPPDGRLDHRAQRPRADRPLGRAARQPARHDVPGTPRLLRGPRKQADPAGEGPGRRTGLTFADSPHFAEESMTADWLKMRARGSARMALSVQASGPRRPFKRG